MAFQLEKEQPHTTEEWVMAFQLEKEQPHTTEKRDDDPLGWGKVAAGLAGSHVEEVKAMATTFFSCREVVLQGAGLSVAQVAAIARRPNDVHVVLDAHTAKARVDESSNWVLSCAMKGTDTYGVTTGSPNPQSSKSSGHSVSFFEWLEFSEQWLLASQNTAFV